jgi:long-chain fatty acid transport protein
MMKTWLVIGRAVMLCIAMVGTAAAGGLYLYEVGTPDVGLAGAGYAARAQDASTAFTNPAGMTRLDQSALMVGAQPMYLHLKFNPDGRTSAEADTRPNGQSADDGDGGGFLPSGGLYFVQPVTDQLWLGLAANGYFGLSLDYGNDWVGRYYTDEVTLQTLGVQPAAAWRFNDWLSIGAGASVLYGSLEDKLAVNNVDPALGDGRLKLDDTDWTVQYNLGILIEPWQGTRFGLTYLSEADLDFKDRVSFSGLGPGLEAALDARDLLDAKLDLGMKMPQAVMFSIYHEATDRLALMANLGWQDWSEFGAVDVTVSSLTTNSLTTKLPYKDTWHAALGAQYRLSDAWQLSGGVAYDSEMMDDRDVVPALPVSDTWRLALGTLYQWSENLKLSGAYELAWSGDVDMDVERGPLTGRVSGTYENASLHVVSLSVEWRF